MPALQHLVLRPVGGEFDEGESAAVSFAGLTALQTLVFGSNPQSTFLPRDWAGVAALPALRQLACPVGLADLEWLAKLPALQVLEASLLAAPLGADHYDLGDVLVAVTGALPNLDALLLSAPLQGDDFDASAAALAQFARTRHRLRRLVIDYEEASLEVVERLAMLANIEQLDVARVRQADKAAVGELAEQLLLRGGMQITQGAHWKNLQLIGRSYGWLEWATA